MKRNSACLDLLFSDQTGDIGKRVHLAQAAGFEAVEFWLWSNKDLDALEAALRQTGLGVVGFVAEPMISLVDPANHARFLSALPASMAVAKRLGARFLYIQAGSPVPGMGRATMTAHLVACLTAAADTLAGSGVILLLEPVNSRVDHKGCFLDLASEGLEIIAAVNRPEVRLLFDIYHAAVMGEDAAAVIGDRMDLIAHVHLADHPGRGAPGTGGLDLEGQMRWFRSQGYEGLFGYEHRP